MILRSIKKLGTNIRTLAASLVLLGAVIGASLPAPSAYAAATYSCGTYSSGAYSANDTCGSATSGSGTGTGTVGAPNTGFAKLMEPANLMAILGSLALLIAGVIVMLKSRGRKKHDVSFTNRS
jgi:uncharacterized membrane protein